MTKYIQNIQLINGVKYKINSVPEGGEQGQVLTKTGQNREDLQWVTPEKFDDSQIQQDIESLKNNKANISEVYNKQEIDGKLAGAFHFKGSVASVAELPENAQQGDVYNDETTGANFAFDGTQWDKLSETIDLSVFYTKTQVDGKFATIENIEQQAYAKLADVYTQEQVNTQLSQKADKEHEHTQYALITQLDNFVTSQDVYSKDEIDAIVDDYVTEIPEDYVTEQDLQKKQFVTTSQLNQAVEIKQDKGDYALRSELPNKVSQLINDAQFITLQQVENKADKDDVYTKQEIADLMDEFIVDIPQQYITEEELSAKGFITQEALEIKADKTDLDNLATKQEVTKELNKKVQKDITSASGTAKIFNEASGAGAQFKNTQKNTLSFVGVNDGNDGVFVQIYSKDSSTNVGARLNAAPTGIYYTNGKTNGSYNEEDELVTKAQINALLERIASLEQKVAELTGE